MSWRVCRTRHTLFVSFEMPCVMMGVVFRNFIGLLSVGAFDSEKGCVCISRFKWREVLRLGECYGVEDYVSSGLSRLHAGNSWLVPADIAETAKGLGVTPAATTDVGHYDFSQKLSGVFSNFFLNRRLNRIVSNEIHSIDTSVASLEFLLKMAETVRNLLTTDRNLRSVIGLGAYLRVSGDKVDFIKLDKWLRSLRIKNMANLIGSYLVILFGFSPDELPFMDAIDKSLYAKVQKSAVRVAASGKRDSDEGSGRVRMRGIMNPVRKPNLHAARYLMYCPLEALSRIVGNVGRSISNVEE